LNDGLIADLELRSILSGVLDGLEVIHARALLHRDLKPTNIMLREDGAQLPASHTVELTFILPPDSVGGGVGNVPGILMKSNEQARGTPLSGLAVKVTDGFFLVGLSNVDADRASNLHLLKERSWFDVPLVMSTSAAPSSPSKRALPAN